MSILFSKDSPYNSFLNFIFILNCYFYADVFDVIYTCQKKSAYKINANFQQATKAHHSNDINLVFVESIS